MPRLRVRDFGTALDFSGSSSNKVVAPYTFPTDAFTLTFWYKTKSKGGLGTGTSTFASGEGWFDQAGSILLGRQGTNDYQAYAYLNAPTDFATPRRLRFRGLYMPNGDGKWHHRVYVFYVVSGSAKLDEYEDGLKLGSTHSVDYTGDATTPSGNLNIGNNPNFGTVNFNGLMDEVKIFNRQLTATEISNFYYASVNPYASNAEWLFNETSGTTALDSSGNGNNGTITGATYTTDVVMKARTTAGSRMQIRDNKTSLNFIGGTSSIDAGTDFIGTGNITVVGWIKPKGYANGRIIDNGKFILFTQSPTGTIGVQSDAVTTAVSSSIPIGSWTHLMVTRTSAGVVNIYVNGVLSGSANQSSGTPAAAISNTFIGNRAALDRGLVSYLNSLRVFNRILTTTELQNIYNAGTAPSDSATSSVATYNFNEGAGTNATDSSGNGHNGTITATSYSSDVPMIPRQQVNGNLLKNNDFEFAPPFTAATNTTARWIDGTAAGSSTNDVFGWGVAGGGTFAAQFDSTVKHSGNYSIKLSTLATVSQLSISIHRTSAANVLKYGIPVLPNTSYTASGWMKTNYVSGDSNNGAAIVFLEFDGTGSSSGTRVIGSYVKTTQDWTFSSGSFTTGATTRFIGSDIRVYGQTGTATLIMDAWFDDIVLTPTTPTARLTA